MNRRQFTRLAALASTFAPFLIGCREAYKSNENLPHNSDLNTDPKLLKSRANTLSLKAHQDLMAAHDVKMQGNEKIAMLLYPGFTALDLVGPQFLFAAMMGAEVCLVSPTDDLSPVMSDTKLSITPTHTRSQCPDHLDLLFLPGGASGTLKALKNPDFINFIQQKAANAKYITSVCTGSLLLGKAGLLKGKHATSHWVCLDLLTKFGAMPIKERVVWDGHIVTGAGVTAGLDFGLQIVDALRGETYAKALQLQLEYDPQPPFNGGSPEKADAFIQEVVTGMFEPLVVDLAAAI